MKNLKSAVIIALIMSVTNVVTAQHDHSKMNMKQDDHNMMNHDKSMVKPMLKRHKKRLKCLLEF